MNLQRKTFSFLTRFCLFIIIIQLVNCIPILAVGDQPEIAFTEAKTFEIPSKNSSIRFTTNGTYQSAIIEEGTWTFKNLYFSNFLSQEKLNITISATDCNVTIDPYLIFNRISRGENVKWVILRYRVSGRGIQVFNMGLDPKEGQLDAILDGEFIGLNQGWTRASDGTLTITAPATNVTLWFYGYPESYINRKDSLDEHYVVITSTFSVAIIVASAIVITLKKKPVK